MKRLDGAQRLQSVLAAGGQPVLGDGDRLTLDGPQLLAASHELGRRLVDLSLHRVALYADNGPGWVLVDLACLFAGITLLPLPLFFSTPQLQHALDTCAVDAILTDRPIALGQLLGMGRVEPQTLPTDLSLVRLPVPANRPQLPQGTQKITFTSGSTGKPKGVCLGIQHQLAVAGAIERRLGETSIRHLCLLPLPTLLENVAGVYTPLLSGGEIVVPPLAEVGLAGSSGLNPGALRDAIDRHRPHSIILLPQTLALLVDALQQGWRAPDSLRFVAVGGGRVAPELLHLGQCLGLPVHEGYGLSECGSVVSLNAGPQVRAGSVGKVLDHLAVSVIDEEIRVRGNTFLGYAGDPGSWYPEEVVTGDLGHLDKDGFLYIAGRRKNLLINSFGRNINPEWLESELLSNLAIAQAVVVGDGLPHCVALIFLRPGGEAGLAGSMSRLNRRLPDYARIRRWHVMQEPLSVAGGTLTENGRPRRDRVMQRFRHQIEKMYPTPDRKFSNQGGI